MSQEISTVDMTAWIGQYPFRGIIRSTLAHLEDRLDALHIERAVVSPFDALFWENNLDAFEQWAARLAEAGGIKGRGGSDYSGAHDRLELWPVVNPAAPGQLAALEKVVDTHRPRGLRLLSNYHGYSLMDACVEPFMDFARHRDMVVQVFEQIADHRWHWMLHVPPVPINQIEYLTARYPDQRLLLSGMIRPAAVVDRLHRHPNLYIDLGRTRGPVFAVERLMKQAPADRVVFGSLWPLQVIEATLWQVTLADIPAPQKQAILRDNALQLLPPHATASTNTNGRAAQGATP